MGKLTTHVLDTAHGCPAAGVQIALYRLTAQRVLISQARTNDDGRCDAPLLDSGEIVPGQYELEFHVGAYFSARGIDLGEPAFLDQVPIRFGIARASQHYHVPLLISPFGYSTYRGS